MADEIREVVGFDLGHGETAVARAVVAANAQPEMLEINGRKTQITALALHPQRGVIVGEQALTMPGVTQLVVAFKRKPNNDPEYRRVMQQYLQAYYRLLVESKQVQGGMETQFIVGCPAGWSIEEQSDYEALLRECGIPQLKVVPESRAALMHAKESGKFNTEELRSPILVVDIGSLTTDFTLLKNLEIKPKDFGDNTLGGALIEKALLRRTLKKSSDPELAKVLDRFPVYQARCELKCRQAKQIYFSNEELFESPETQVEAGLVRILKGDAAGGSLIFEPIVNGPIMGEILAEPLAELGGKTWPQVYRERLERTREKLGLDGAMPSVILFTGGAARMRFTQEMCREIFPESDVRLDSEPEFCIARGLARLGRWERRAYQFKGKVEILSNSGEIGEIVGRRRSELVQSLGEALAHGFTSAAVKPALRDWRDGKISTLAQMETRAGEDSARWLKSSNGREIVRSACANWLNLIQADLSVLAGQICQEFRLPGSALALDITPDLTQVETDKVTGLDDPANLKTITEMIVAVVIASLLGGGGIALLMHGPVGWIIGLVIGMGVVIVSERVAKEQIKRLEIPHLVRSVILSDAKIEAKCEEVATTLAKTLSDNLASNEKLFADLDEKVRAQVRGVLRARADEATILIQ